MDDPGLRLAKELWIKSDEIFKKERIEDRVKAMSRLYRTRGQGPDENVRANPSVILVNKVFPMVRASIASLFAKKPDVLVKPSKLEDALGAQGMEMLLKWLTHVMKYPIVIRRMLRSATLYQFGCVKMGSDKADGGVPWIESFTPEDVRGDPGQKRFVPEEGRYVSFKFVRTLAALRATGTYQETALDHLHDGMKKQFGEEYDEGQSPLVLWEHYVRDGSDILIVTQPNESEMNLRKEGETFVRAAGLPVRTLVFNETDDSYYPLALSELFLDQLKEKNVIHTQQLLHAERSNSLTLFDVNRFSKDELDKVQRNEPKAWLGTDGPPGEIVQAYNQGNLSSDVYAGESRIDLDLQEGFGLGSLQMGAEDRRPSRSATEASIVEGNLRLRSTDRQEIFEDFLESLYTGIGKLAQKTLAKDIWLMVTDSLPVKLDRGSIQGDFRYQISFGSTLPHNQSTERADAERIWTMLSPLAFGPTPKIKGDKLLRYVLSRWDVKDAVDWIVSAPPPVPAPMPAPAPAQVGPPSQEAPPVQPPPALLAALLNRAAVSSAQGNGAPLDFAGALRRSVGGRG